jgi:hypothetical protein
VAAIPVNCRFAATFSNKMSLQISLTSLPEHYVHLSIRLARCGFDRADLGTALVCLWVLSFANLS